MQTEIRVFSRKIDERKTHKKHQYEVKSTTNTFKLLLLHALRNEYLTVHTIEYLGIIRKLNIRKIIV